MILAAVLVSMAFGQSPGPALWVALCSNSASSPADGLTTYEAPDGRVQTTHVAATAPVGCVATPLPIAYEDVVWVRLVAPATTNRLSRGLILLGGDGVPSSGSEIVLPDETSQAPTQVSAVSSNRSSALSEGQPPIRAMWAWRPELWRSEASSLFARASSWNVGVLYVSVQVGADGALVDADRLRAFLRDAGDRRLRVWAVEGDPRAVMEAERTAMVQRARAIRSFNAAGSPGFDGVQYDIEPYLVPGYALNEEQWNEAYVATIEQLRKAAAMPVEVAVPFWWLNARTADGRVMDRVSAFIESVAVMDYRTDPDTIERLAEPWLDWGEAHKRRIRVALEAGRLPDEPRYHFRPAPSGTLLQIKIGDRDALVLVRAPYANRSGAAFRLIRTSTFEASTVTFFGRAGNLRSLLPTLERRFSGYGSFAGIALHEVPPPDAAR
ncbi:MAG TPA: hypothetical protein VKE96_34435 [Vicinamibacterales bacterium]|nr:hypothetical protein [Vicinamibacterales bacterium]